MDDATQGLLLALMRGLDLPERAAWHAGAACRGRGPGAWFPERGSDARRTGASAVCAVCAWPGRSTTGRS